MRRSDRFPVQPDNLLHWSENGHECSARWHSENDSPAPKRIFVADDTLSADQAYRLACEGTAILWRGDFNNARLLLQAMARRIDRKGKRINKTAPTKPGEAFHLHRQAQAQRARTLNMLLLPFDAGHRIPLRRAPNVVEACTEAHGPADEPYVASLRGLLGLIGAHEWRKKGVDISVLGGRIHPHYAVFSPVRGEYVQLVAETPLPSGAENLAVDIGTGTGVLAAMLVKRGVAHVIATEQDSRALACAQENIHRLGLENRITLLRADLFPHEPTPLIVCNPPWVPARPSSSLEHAIYDPDSRMLRGFLNGLAAHLTPCGEGWLILSDFAEHLGLRTRAELLAWIDAAGLIVKHRRDIYPHHPKTTDTSDALHAARSAETTSLWQLVAR